MKEKERNPTCYCCRKELKKVQVFETFTVPKKRDNGYKTRRIKDTTFQWPCNCRKLYDERCDMCHKCPEHHRCEVMVA